MANVIQSIIDRIENYRATNKSPCKSYATQRAAELAADKYAAKIGAYFSDNEKERPDYLVFFNPAWGRYCVAFNITPLLNKYGGYGGIASYYGFFNY